MTEETEYDELLRSVFDSCDGSGTGRLSRFEFKNLCGQLCLEEEHYLLEKILFKSISSKLNYDQFKEVLLLLLAGNLSEASAKKSDLESSEENLFIQFEDRSFDSSTPKSRRRRSRVDMTDQERDEECPNPFVNRKTSQEHVVIDFSDPQNMKNPSTLSYNLQNTEISSTEKLSNEERLNRSTRSNFALEEITGTGNGEEWIIPNSFDSALTKTDDYDVTTPDQSQSAEQAHEALAAVWLGIIGDFSKKITVLQLQDLFRSQSLTTSSSDVEKLFVMLDEDGDGLISFGDFAQQMSAFFLPDNDSDNKSLDQSEKTDSGLLISSEINEQSKNNKDPFPLPIASSPEGMQSNIPEKHDSSSSLLLSSSMTSATDDSKLNTSSSNMDQTSPCNPIAMEAETGENRSSGNPEVEDEMANYHGAPPYRKNRKSSRASSRYRRRSSKAVSLPHYHPIRMQNLEDCPLYFLTDEQERYVSAERLQNLFSSAGIEKQDQIFEDLRLDRGESFNIETLSEAFEEELEHHPLHRALCAIYKSGISYYKAQRDHEASERKRLEVCLKHRDTQMVDEEERLEKMEQDYKTELESLEKRYKNKISRLEIKMETDRDQRDKINIEKVNEMELQIERMKKAQTKLKKELDHKELERTNLLKKCKDLEDELETCNENALSMRSDVERICKETVVQSDAHMEQRKKVEKMLMEYKEESKRLQDRNDELINHLDGFSKRWKHFSRSIKENTQREPLANSLFESIRKDAQRKSNSTHNVSNSSPRRYVNTVSIKPSSESETQNTPYKSTLLIRSRSSVSAGSSASKPNKVKNETL